MKRQYVRRVDEEVRPIVVALRICREFAEIGLDLPLLGAPREIGIGLRKAELGQSLHQLRSCECFGEEYDVWVPTLDVIDQPLPEVERLRVRIVDAEDAHALADPEQQHIADGVPQ